MTKLDCHRKEQKKKLTGIDIPNGSLLEKSVDIQELLITWLSLQVLDLISGGVELLKKRNNITLQLTINYKIIE